MRDDGPDLPFVFVATPLGQGGKGGIDRLMDAVKSVVGAYGGYSQYVYFGRTRGHGSLVFAPFFLMTFLLRMIGSRLINRCDLVHINLASFGSTTRKLFVIRVARALGIPYVVHLHGALYRDYFARCSPSLKSRIKRAFGNAARVVVLGGIWRDFAVETLGVAPDHIVLMPNAVPTPILAHQASVDGIVRLVFLGRLGERKGSRDLVEALERIRDVPGWRAVIAGDGEIEETRRAVEDAELGERVDVPGWLGPDETAVLVSVSDILVLPSFAENLPMSVVEGMAAGLAVIATPVGATPDIVIHDETGLLVPPGDVDALAAAITQLVSNDTLRKRLGMTAQKFHRDHLEIGAYSRRLCALWREIVLCH